ncbi:putative BPI/LBP family protein [Prunus yedoensis var. nudiflora]|uniref:Putative BPI/LBP family protein n=1 Tax=Prunus yedoensis var. nudiflora TaxID=2094558 RepID=A0A314YTH3_PRUYE|nr:putative BPI/LBP family protein [Prunus yedoensis var. nudiflora]
MAPNDDFASGLYNKGSLDHVPFNAPAKMVEISLHENVFSSVSLVFFNANYMQWVINKIPDQSLLNTAGWKYIVPQLYKQYPNEDMELNISASSPPIMTVVNNGINITVYSDVTIGVMDADEVIPVACISLEIHASCSPDVLINKLAGTVKLNHVTAYLKWSKIGNLHMHLVQAVLSTILKTVVVPYVNLHLRKGLPLPLPHGFTLHNSEIVSINSRLTIFSDVAIAERSPTSVSRPLISIR